MANPIINLGGNSIKKWQNGLPALGAAAFLVVRGSLVIAIIISPLLRLILYRDRKIQHGGQVEVDYGAFLKNLATPLFLLLVLTAGLFILYYLDQKLFDLSALMLKVDLFAFGGGYGSVPIMLHEVVGSRHWMDSKTFMNGIAPGQVTLGPIIITTTFLCYLMPELLLAVRNWRIGAYPGKVAW